jgi:hypothetical protein
MQFNLSNHKSVAWLNLLFLAFFVAGVHWYRPQPVTIVSAQVESYNTLDHSEKLQILENSHNTSAHELPLSLHFTRHDVELGPVILMLGLVMTLYSLLSSNWVHSCNSEYSGLGEFDISSVSTDGTAVMMDLFFWAVFILLHAVVFLFIMKLCMHDELVFFLMATTVFTWMLCCRILQRYSPVLFAAGFSLFYAHGKPLFPFLRCLPFAILTLSCSPRRQVLPGQRRPRRRQLDRVLSVVHARRVAARRAQLRRLAAARDSAELQDPLRFWVRGIRDRRAVFLSAVHFPWYFERTADIKASPSLRHQRRKIFRDACERASLALFPGVLCVGGETRARGCAARERPAIQYV